MHKGFYVGHFLPLRSCFILDFSAKCMLGRHGLWFLFRKIFCKKSHKLDGKNLIFIFFFVYFAAVCLLPSEFLLQKNFFDMVPGFDQTQVEKMQFHIGFHNIYSKYKPRNREYTNNIFENFFLSPSWRHGPQIITSPKTHCQPIGFVIICWTSHELPMRPLQDKL